MHEEGISPTILKKSSKNWRIIQEVIQELLLPEVSKLYDPVMKKVTCSDAVFSRKVK